MNPAFIRQLKRTRRLPQLITAGLLLFATLRCALATENPVQASLILGIHPYKSATTLVESYKPLAAYLSRKTGRPITIEIARDYHTHIRLIGENKVDIAYMGPASYVELVKHYGKKPLLARQAIHDNPAFHGKIILRQDSPITALAELKGKRFAFGDVASTMSHLVPRYMLRQAGVTVDQLARHDFLGSHDNVALAVLAGDYDAGAVKEAVYEKYQPRGLKILASTPALSEHLFVASNTLPTELVQNLRSALYELEHDPGGPAIMNKIKTGLTAWVAVDDADYDNLRTILDALDKAGIQP